MPAVGGVLGAISCQRLDSGLLDVIGSGEVRLAGAEVHNVQAAGFHALGFHQDGGGG